MRLLIEEMFFKDAYWEVFCDTGATRHGDAEQLRDGEMYAEDFV